MDLLNKIQQQLKVPKGQFNSFGKYAYRNAEDILEAVKPLLGDGVLTLTDSIFETATGRTYVVATATLEWREGAKHEYRSVQGYAREALDKKGMDEAQITGAASSYARKYALNGLFCIDDTKDADSDEQPKAAPQAKPVEVPKPSFIAQVQAHTKERKARVKELVDAKALNPVEGKEGYEKYVLENTGLKLTVDNLPDIISRLEQLK